MYAAFASLAVLSGLVNGFASEALLVPANQQVFAALALASLLAGIGLVAWAATHGHRAGGAKHWRALVLLQIPQWCGAPLSSLATPIPWLHGLGWGTALLLAVAAPLWLALLVAIGVARAEVPRTVVAVTVIAIGAVCLVVPLHALTVYGPQVPMLMLQTVLSIATVFSWVLARGAFEDLTAESAAGCYLLLSAFGNIFFAFIYEQSGWRHIDWRALPVPLLENVLLLAAMWWLWFWLFQRIPFTAFTMRALAAWCAALLPGFFMFGFLQWRMDAAIVISLLAVAVALRARTAEEQPVLLGLSDS